MKLLNKISAAAAGLALVAAAFTGCVNSYEDRDPVGDLTGICLRGSMNSWGTDELVAGDETGFYSVTWQAAGESEQFKLADADWTKEYGLEGLSFTVGESATLIANPGYNGNVTVTGLTTGSWYKFDLIAGPTTVEIALSETTASNSGSGSGSSATPVPYYLDGYFILGPEEIGGNSSWAASLDTLLTNPTKDSENGYLTYKYVFTSSSTEVQFGIGTKGWATKYTGATFAVGETTDFVECTKGSDTNNSITGMTVGTEYRILVQTTPEEKISFKVEENVEETHLMTLKFEVTNLSEGDEAWINGEFWSGWATGWPIADWGAFGSGFEATDAAVADETGVASFGEKFDVGIDEAVGTALSYKFKAIASSDGWTNADKLNPASNLTCDITVAEGTYIVSVNATTEAVTVRKAE
mgnify:CR=1 FL=1